MIRIIKTIDFVSVTSFFNNIDLSHRYFAATESEKTPMLPEKKLKNKFGQSSAFVASTLIEDGGILKNASPASLLKEAIHVISCGYEDKTDWGKEVALLILLLCYFIFA